MKIGNRKLVDWIFRMVLPSSDESIHYAKHQVKKTSVWSFCDEKTLNYERIWIFRFFPKQINARFLWTLCIKGTKESTLEVDSSVSLTPYDLRDLVLTYLVKKSKIRFQIFPDLRILSWIFVKKCTLSFGVSGDIREENIIFVSLSLYPVVRYTTSRKWVINSNKRNESFST